jgi:hypothetical protein
MPFVSASCLGACLLAAAPASAAPLLCLGNVDTSGTREGIVTVLTERTRTLANDLGAVLVEGGEGCSATVNLSAVRVGPAVQVRVAVTFIDGSPAVEHAYTEPYDRFPGSPDLAQTLATVVTELRARHPELVLHTPASATSGGERLFGIGVPASAAFATTLAAAGAGLFFGLRARSHHDAASDPELVGRQLELADARFSQRAANISYAVAATSALTGVLLAWLLAPEAP